MEEIAQKKEQIKTAIEKIVGFMNLECQVDFKDEKTDEGETIFVSIYTPENARFLIGKNGQNLQALEYVAKLISIKDKNPVNLVVDVNDYKKSRATYLMDLAKQAVSRVRNTQKAEALMPMTPYERRVVHMELAACPDIATESIGEEPHRRVVIKPYP